MRDRETHLPRLLPLAAIPFAKAFFVVKYCGKIATEGTNRQPLPRPTHIPWASMTAQYCVQRLVIMIPKTTRMEPVQTRVWK